MSNQEACWQSHDDYEPEMEKMKTTLAIVPRALGACVLQGAVELGMQMF